MNKRIFHRNAIILPESRSYLERPRIDRLLADAVRRPYVLVTAGAGYGKTQAVHSFLLQYDASTVWVQLSERDNLSSRFWENVVRTVSLFNERIAQRLLEFGFPNNDDLYGKIITVLEDELIPNEKYVLVFDDFHLVENPSVLGFIRRTLYTPFANITLALISRSEPPLNTVLPLAKGLLFTVGEDELRFSEKETAEYFQLLGLNLSSQSVADIHRDTGGWALALNLLGLSLKKAPAQEQIARAAMKLNIFKLMESEIFLVIPERLRRFLVRLSLIDHLPASLISALAGDPTLEEELKKVSSFIRYDNYTDAYLIHHLFLDYLRRKQDQLTEEEKRDTYRQAARWCDENDFKMDAISYYEKAGEYEAIMRIVRQFQTQIPTEQAKFVLDIYDRGPTELLEGVAAYHLQRFRLLMSLARYPDLVAETNARIAKYSALPPSDFNNRILCGAYFALGVTSYQTLPKTGRCDFDQLLEKADYYYRLSPWKERSPATSLALNAWASRVATTRSGAMEEYIETLTRAIPFAAEALSGFMSGLDDLARGELHFYRGDLQTARKLIRQAQARAESHAQYEIRNRALFYLLRIGVAQGDYEETQSLFQELEAQLKMPEYNNRFITYDIVSSWYYSLIGREFAAHWLRGRAANESAGYLSVNFANQVRARLDYSDKRWSDLLTLLESMRSPYDPLFAQLEHKALEAVCRFQLKERGAALVALGEAYELALSNNITMPFIELGKDMRTLTAAAQREKNCAIPRPWLEMINRKAATYAKHLGLVVAEYKKAHNIGSGAALSTREKNVLRDLYHGLSRAEIAANHNLSLNTVKMILSAIYTKLDADNMADVVRIALEQDLIK
ncbi:MAG: LuxR C-terminal-related transcriptional regulator [Gracilibacteraceae bacterium]|jgi:LuxR family maltose regulon positive regulatory protein|nr:LuxR C-terminal-related transcriptional regulator [Gracilibacteraceae bacterium]